jgi:cytochrome c oxidase cbb3-type subunit 3
MMKMSEDNNQNENESKDMDKVSGVETTGHEWDGLKELNNPLPRWWVWVFLVSCIWGIWYMVAYPAWPVSGGATKGTSGYTQFKELTQSQSEIIARQAVYLESFESADFNTIMNDPALYAFAYAGGKAAFKDNCATCHGSGAEGSKGYPNLNDDDWLWGGTVGDIYNTLQHGIRVEGDYDTRLSQMPAFGKDELLNREEINQTIDYVLALHNASADESMAGHTIFQNNCASCHGADGTGLREFGAPNLADAIWLYGGNRADIYESIFNARAGMMPAWKNRLDENTIRQLSVYVHELGGGEASVADAVRPLLEE